MIDFATGEVTEWSMVHAWRESVASSKISHLRDSAHTRMWASSSRRASSRLSHFRPAISTTHP